MKPLFMTLIVELVTALLLEALLEALRNTKISTDPPSLETWIGPVGVRIDLNGIQIQFLLEA